MPDMYHADNLALGCVPWLPATWLAETLHCGAWAGDYFQRDCSPEPTSLRTGALRRRVPVIGPSLLAHIDLTLQWPDAF
ncbi:hypothetical protein BN2475_520008 [Paraburkholderia ribeironis]|uniref:Uncharacterized protein n=1 Tax=Paraburkholderia ribeironis TaxID=1247936 RepID=A0A1N7SCD3_9BURK|nr:hypothetical protein BN2475_520008 [Paraburkholderia ribeironis]